MAEQTVGPQLAYQYVPVCRIKVSWKDGKPVADPDEAKVNTHNHEPTIIIWRADKDVKSIEEIKFIGSQSEITPPVGQGGGADQKVWVAIDRCSQEGEFDYCITAVHKDGGDPVSSDPMIRNEDGG